MGGGGTYAGSIDHPGQQPVAMPSINDPIQSSGVKTTGAVTTTPALLWGYVLEGATASVDFANGNGGTSLWKDWNLTATEATRMFFHKPLAFDASLYVTISGTCYILYA